MQQSLNNSTIVAYSSETAKLLCSNDKVTVRELWLEVPVVDIYVAHLKRLNLDELKTDTADRLETLKDLQKRKKEEERVIQEQKLNERLLEEEKRAEQRKKRIELAENKRVERLRL